MVMGKSIQKSTYEGYYQKPLVQGRQIHTENNYFPGEDKAPHLPGWEGLNIVNQLRSGIHITQRNVSYQSLLIFTIPVTSEKRNSFKAAHRGL